MGGIAPFRAQPSKSFNLATRHSHTHTHTRARAKQGHQKIYTNKSEKGREQRSRNFKHVASSSARNQTKLNAIVLYFVFSSEANGNAESDRSSSRNRKLNIQRNQQDKHKDITTKKNKINNKGRQIIKVKVSFIVFLFVVIFC